jgi:hypothetical protein
LKANSRPELLNRQPASESWRRQRLAWAELSGVGDEVPFAWGTAPNGL